MHNNDHIRDLLKYYCDLPKEPQYAVLLTGLWGCGKTWFIKDFVENQLSNSEHVLYLSLYGMQTFDDIESELFRLRHPVLGSKSARILHRLARGVLKTSINFDIDGDGKADGSVSGGIPTEKLLERVSLDSGQILIFDDLERCSIPIADLLGYINQFIEHGGLKSILIANEIELHRENVTPDANYARIKEKLIGRTLEIEPEVTRALEHFAAELPAARAQAVIKSNFTLITQVYECSKYKNLRLVRHALWDFDRLCQSLEQPALASDELLRDLLALFLSYSLEIQSGAVKPCEISKLRENWSHLRRQNSNEPDPNQHLHDIRQKYVGLNLQTSLVTEHIWKTIFTTGSIPHPELNEALLKSKYFIDANQANWVKLWHGIYLSDEAFAKTLEVVESEWRNHHYKNLGEIIHITGLFIHYALNGIYHHSIDKIIASAKGYLQQMLNNNEIPPIELNSPPSPFEYDSYAGLGFRGMEEQAFCAFLDYVGDLRRQALTSSLPQRAKELLSLVNTDSLLFCRRIILNNHPENTYYKTPILHLISANEFVEAILTTAPEHRGTIARALNERYSIHQFNAELLPELDWLKDVSKLLQKEVEARAGKVSSLALTYMLNPHLHNAISQLQRANETDTVSANSAPTPTQRED